MKEYNPPVRESEFWLNIDRAFPHGRGRSAAQDLVLSALGDRSPAQALEAGEDPQRIWDAVCDTMGFPDYYHYLHRLSPEDFAARE
ncbi:DUF3046 domain-containing protein [Actinotignum sp. UMB0459]|uniref:DUF3046 domain-containing protein n=1 Tax=Actinotignum sp. UMB0459 TaxID=3449314 RepID=UPI003F762875